MVANFNTSHVTVYREALSRKGHKKIISIHLMLRFITSGYIGIKRQDLFQYISCYGLSMTADYLDSLDLRFQYISCYGLSKIPPAARNTS